MENPKTKNDDRPKSSPYVQIALIVVGLLLLVVFVLVLTSLSGPSLGNTFSNISRGLQRS